MSMVDIVAQLKKILGKFEKVQGVRIWGIDETGTPRLIKVDSEGYVLIKSE